MQQKYFHLSLLPSHLPVRNYENQLQLYCSFCEFPEYNFKFTLMFNVTVVCYTQTPEEHCGSGPALVPKQMVIAEYSVPN